MIELGESTGGLAADVDQRGRVLRGRRFQFRVGGPQPDRAVIMIIMGIFVAFVLISLYLPIFSWRIRYTL